MADLGYWVTVNLIKVLKKWDIKQITITFNHTFDTHTMLKPVINCLITTNLEKICIIDHWHLAAQLVVI